MNKVEVVSTNVNYTAVTVGKLDDLMSHSLIHPKLGHTIEGKVFLKAPTDATGTEVSFNILPPSTDVSYFHVHTKNEETYVILKGAGFFQVDDDCFEISEGSVVRVAPQGKRGMGNTSKDTMIYMVIQSKEGSLEEHTSDDGSRVEAMPQWKQPNM